MGLKTDLESAFNNTLENGGTSDELATAITAAYENACNSGSDIIGNSYKGQSFSLVETSIKAAFAICINAKTIPLNLIPVSASLVACWATASLKLPATHPGFSVVQSGNVTVSIPPPTPPLIGESDNIDPIVNAFFNMFTLHAKSIQFLYSGLALAGSPPPPITIPATIFNIN
tara:strand:+ start:1308 stop:1826 length:519 start_codon:yes stop_codon:yes gene_type:complete